MAKTTAKKKAYNKKYYRTHPKKRQEMIDKQIAKQKANPEKYARKSREYYHKDKDYREYKIDYARDYRRKHKKRRTS